jgi:hypothetical protein
MIDCEGAYHPGEVHFAFAGGATVAYKDIYFIDAASYLKKDKKALRPVPLDRQNKFVISGSCICHMPVCSFRPSRICFDCIPLILTTLRNSDDGHRIL